MHVVHTVGLLVVLEQTVDAYFPLPQTEQVLHTGLLVTQAVVMYWLAKQEIQGLHRVSLVSVHEEEK